MSWKVTPMPAASGMNRAKYPPVVVAHPVLNVGGILFSTMCDHTVPSAPHLDLRVASRMVFDVPSVKLDPMFTLGLVRVGHCLNPLHADGTSPAIARTLNAKLSGTPLPREVATIAWPASGSNGDR